MAPSSGQAFQGWANRLGEGQVAALLGSLLAPGAAILQGKIHAAAPLILPPPGAILSALLKGRITPQLASWALGKSGVNLGQARANEKGKALGVAVDEAADLWQAVLKEMILYPGPTDLLGAYWRGLLGEEGSPEAKAKLNEWGKVNATDAETWQACEPVFRPWPGVGELNTGRNRGILTPLEYAELLRLSTGQRADCRKLHDELRKQPPSYGEIMAICGRTLSNRQDSPLSHLWKEFPESLRKWAGWVGLDFDTNIEAPRGAAEGTVRWPLALWANHWRSPGWGQLREMLWRIRDDNRNDWSAVNPDAASLSADDVREWLRHDGTPANVREQLLAMRYLPVSIRYLKTMWQQNIVDNDFARSELKSNGNDPRVVDYIIASWIKEKEQKEQQKHEQKQAECAKQVIKAIEADIELGLMDFADARKELLIRGVNAEDFPDCFVAANQRRVHRLKAAILAKVKGLYMTGGLDLEGAAKELVAQGFTQLAATEYLQAWTDELSLELRQTAGASVAQWLRLGLLDRGTAERMLSNLGFAGVDTALLLLSADESADRLQADAIATLQPGNRVAASQVVRLLKSTERIRRQAQLTLRRLFPIGRIKREYVSHLKSEEWARDKLANIGEDLESRDDYLRDWNAEIEAKASKAHKPKATGVPSRAAQAAPEITASPESSAPPPTP